MVSIEEWSVELLLANPEGQQTDKESALIFALGFLGPHPLGAVGEGGIWGHSKREMAEDTVNAPFMEMRTCRRTEVCWLCCA